MDKEFVSFKLADDPIEYKLSYDFNEIVGAEGITGCNLLRAQAGSMTATDFRALLYACLKTGHPLVTLPEAGDLMTRDRNTVMLALGRVLGGAEEEEEPAKEEPKETPVKDETPAVTA